MYSFPYLFYKQMQDKIITTDRINGGGYETTNKNDSNLLSGFQFPANINDNEQCCNTANSILSKYCGQPKRMDHEKEKEKTNREHVGDRINNMQNSAYKRRQQSLKTRNTMLILLSLLLLRSLQTKLKMR